MQEAIAMVNAGKLNPSGLVTHIGGLNAAIDTTLNLPKIPGCKKLIYTQINLPLTAIDEFEEKGKTDPMFAAGPSVQGKQRPVEPHSRKVPAAQCQEYLIKPRRNQTEVHDYKRR